MNPDVDTDVKIYGSEGNAARKARLAETGIREWVLPPDPMAHTQKLSCAVPHEIREEAPLFGGDAERRFRVVAIVLVAASIFLGLCMLSRISCRAAAQLSDERFMEELGTCETAMLRTEGISIRSEAPVSAVQLREATPFLEFSASVFGFLSTLNFSIVS